MSAASPLRIDAPRYSGGSPDADLLARVPPAALTGYLATRRWFGAKGRTPVHAAFATVIPVGGETAASLATVHVRFDDAEAMYQLPVAAVPIESTAGERRETRVIVTVRAATGEWNLVDATEHAPFLAWVAGTLSRGGEIRSDGDSWRVEATSAGAGLLRGDEPVRVIAGEQSNTSMVFGDHAILKLYRRIEYGENPDAEISRFLSTRTAFRNTPALIGTVTLEAAGEHATAGMAQEYLSGARDAWEYTLEVGRRYFGAPTEQENESPNPLAGELGQLGATTRELHEALSSRDDDPEFTPLDAGGADVRRWAEHARQMALSAVELLRQQLAAGRLPQQRRAEADVLARRGDAYVDYIDELATALESDAGARIRHHGDYHLGQVLRARDGGFMIIDFEGEPARPMEERRARHSPLRDVAGMLRSLAYAAAMLGDEVRDRLGMRVAEVRTARWERELRTAFLSGYLSRGASSILPRSRKSTDALLSLFETEKAFYELAYELNNRPDWVWIPLRGISRLLVAPSAQSRGGSGRAENGGRA